MKSKLTLKSDATAISKEITSITDYLLQKYTLLESLIVSKPELNDDLPISAINAASTSFEFLEDEPEIY